MGFLNKLTRALFGGSGGSGGGGAYYYYVRCRRCGEIIKGRVNLANDLSAEYDGDNTSGYVYRKSLIGSGSNRCFQAIEVELSFDPQRKILAREIKGGDFVTEEEYEAANKA